MADIPGLIDGAHAGAGLGDAFLRHIERTRMILHVVEMPADETAAGQPTPVDAYRAIRDELEQHSPALAEKPELLVANKMDLSGADVWLERLRETVDQDVPAISAVTGAGLPEMLDRLWKALSAERSAASDADDRA